MSSLHHDTGLQPERTLLAWRRTLLSLLAVSILFLRWIPHHGAFALGLIGVAMLTVMGIWLGQWRRYRVSTRAICENRTPVALGEIAALGIACTVLGALGIYVVLWF
jgi:uncharacterized membrane protein YidH (DUF202 family)